MCFDDGKIANTDFRHHKDQISVCAQHGQVVHEELRAGQLGLQQCLAAPVQLGFQRHQRESREAAQEQPACSAQGI